MTLKDAHNIAAGVSAENGELPEGWALTRTEDAGRWSTGGTPSRKVERYFGGAIPWVKSGDLRDGPVTESNELITVEGLESSAAKVLPVGTVSIALYGATIGKLGILQIEAATNQACANCQVDERAIHREYLFYYLLHERKALIEAGQGGAQPNLTNAIVRNWPLLVPPLAEQKRIVAKVEGLLARVRAARERLPKVPAILKRFRQSVLAAACSGQLTEDWREEHPDVEPARAVLDRLVVRRRVVWERWESAKWKSKGKSQTDERWKRRYRPPFEPQNRFALEMPGTWIPVTTSHLALLDVGHAFRSTEFADSGIRLLRGENLEPGAFRWEDVRYWTESKMRGFEHLLVEEGEIILAMDRPVVSAGLKIARATSRDVPCLLVQRMTRFKMVDRALTGFLHLCLQCDDFIEHLSHGLTGSDLPHITGTAVAEYTFGLPPIREIDEIVRRVDALFRLADMIEKRVAAATTRAEKLTQAVLAKAFRGELVPTEAELARQERRDYEPASVLLERIRAERAAAGHEPKPKRRRAGRKARSKPAETSEPEAEPDEEAARRPAVRRTPPGRPKPATTRPATDALDGFTTDQVMAAFRQACWWAGEISEDEMLRKVARRLGFNRLAKSLRARLKGHLRAAVRRQIVARNGDLLSAATPTMADYTADDLRAVLVSVMRKGTTYDREDVIRAVAAHLGFARLRASIREPIRSVINSAIRRGALNYKGSNIWRE